MDPNESYREGVELLEAGDCKEAEKKFRSVLKVVPRSAEANYLRATALRCQGKHKNAAKYFRLAIKYDKSMYVAYERLGSSYLELDKPDDAKKQLARLAELREQCSDECSPQLIRAYDDLNAALLQRTSEGDNPDEEARRSSEEGRQHALLFGGSSEPRAVYLAAIELINSGRFPAAIVELRALTRVVGPNPDVLNYLGYAHRRLGQHEASRSYYEQALALNPMHRGANEYLGELFVELGDLDRARERLAVLDRVCPFGCAEYEDLKRRIESRGVAAR